MNSKIFQVGIKPKNFSDSFTFYNDVLKFPYIGALETSGTVLHRFDIAGAILKLAEGEDTKAHNPGGAPFDATGLRWLSVEVADLDPLVLELKNKGVQFVTHTVTDEHGGRFAIVLDPDDVWVELIETQLKI